MYNKIKDKTSALITLLYMIIYYTTEIFFLEFEYLDNYFLHKEAGSTGNRLKNLFSFLSNKFYEFFRPYSLKENNLDTII